MQPILSNATWLMLSREERAWLRDTFEIPRSGSTEVLDQQIICDGTMIEDLMELTVEKLQEFLKSEETDLYALLDEALEVYHNPIKELVKAESEMKDVGDLKTSIKNANKKENGKKNTKK